MSSALPDLHTVSVRAQSLAAAPITSSAPDSFAWHVWHDRHPALLAKITAAHPYTAAQTRALATLLDETLQHDMRPLSSPTPDKPLWDAWGEPHYGRPWEDAPFLWAESYFYRRLLEAVEYFGPGPWRGIDPFAFLKTTELDATQPANLSLDILADLALEQKTRILLQASLWGNQADLGFRIGSDAASRQFGPAEHLVIDDSDPALATLLGEHQIDRILLIADNAGRELIADLILADHLLSAGIAARVTIHLKPHPYYVSDATMTDAIATLRWLANTPGEAAHIARRLQQASADGGFELTTHWFHCAPLSFHYAPEDLAEAISAATLTLLKGDLNYRRLIGDYTWPLTTDFNLLSTYFPSPVLTLRTLKSDVIVGISDSVSERLYRASPDWRTNGRYGLVQLRQ
jgi:hypothetical protein